VNDVLEMAETWQSDGIVSAEEVIDQLAAEVRQLRERDEAIDALRSVWEESMATRSYVDDRYPGLAHVIDRVIRSYETEVE
jgi:hypothetical protein